MPLALTTGATGFIGSALCRALVQRGYRVRAAVRDADRAARSGDSSLEWIGIGDIGPATDWQSACADVECVVHLAARAHVLNETGGDALSEYRRVNVEGTRRLARAAGRAGVGRFVFVSSIKVNGESTPERPFTENDPPRPGDAYGISKWEAEQVLSEIAAEFRMPTVILRPPLVYGPGVKGNLLELMKAVARGTPLPLASIRNRRSLLFVGNLVDAIIAAIESPAASGKTYLVGDEEVSTPDLVRALAAALRVPARLFPCPPALLKGAAFVLGKSAAAERLVGSLQIDSSRIRHELGWLPRTSFADGLAQMARWYHAQSGPPPI
jgi:nucleoside-diphosphate-sugar epimerase